MCLRGTILLFRNATQSNLIPQCEATGALFDSLLKADWSRERRNDAHSFVAAVTCKSICWLWSEWRDVRT
jgi:hypothetical protein